MRKIKRCRIGDLGHQRLLFLFACLFLLPGDLISIYAQRPRYQIAAVLDTRSHTVSGTIRITWFNTSGDALDSLGIHLWPNAYADKNSAFAAQQLNLGELDFQLAKPEACGGIYGLSFSADQDTLQWHYDAAYNDIGWIIPGTPLQPGDSITIVSPFRLSVPVSFSRLGRTGRSYQCTQWYPHLAVYENNSWQVMPYLDQGEFFNDFADYQVTIQVPANYTIAATGTLADKTQDSVGTLWTFTAENVIDFAWFASPDFQRISSDTIFIDGQPINLRMYIESAGLSAWTNAHTYATRAMQFYSDWLGPYPYPAMSVVHTPWSKAGFMEYPMLAQISYTSDTTFLDLVIAHEIGHTWLYGILANNERQYPWLDEGLNTFIEERYKETYYPRYTEQYFPTSINTKGSMDGEAMIYNARFEGKLQPPAARPENQIGDQYYYSAYQLPAKGLLIMHEMLGEDMMKQMFRAYYASHAFSHVNPEDLRTSFEATCQCDLTWFFEDWINRAETNDYRLGKLNASKKEVTILNKGETKIPVKVSTFLKGKKVNEHWLDGFETIKTIHLDDRFDEVRLYDGMMDVNSVYTANIKPRTWLPRIRLLPQVESYVRPTIGVTPVIGYNQADGFMAGVMLSSGWLPQHHFKMEVTPMYGFEGKKLRGFATLRYTDKLAAGPFDRYVLSLGLDHFGYQLDTHYLFRDRYFKLEPTIALRLRPNADHVHLSSWIKYRFSHIDQYYGRGINYDEYIYDNEHRNYGVHELMYQIRSANILKPFEGYANVQAGKGFVRLNLLFKQHFSGRTKHLGTWLRGFAGWLPVYDQPDANVAFTFNGIASNGFYSKDYMYDQWLGGRNAETGFFSQQAFERDAHLKTLSTIGVGEEWMIGAGISQAFPFRFLHFYMDATVFPSAVTQKTQFSYSGGAALVLVKDVFEVFLPLFESKDIRQSSSYDVRDVWYERISFKANLKFLQPVNLIDREQLGY